MRAFELLVQIKDRRCPVVWDGLDGPAAACRYKDGHPEHEVLAWRPYPRTGFFPAVDFRRVLP